MTSISLHMTDDNAEFHRLVWLLLQHGGYLRTSFARRVKGVWIRTVVADVPSVYQDAVIDGWIGA